MRKCNNCKIEKPLEEYSKDKSRSLGRSYRCKPCSVKVHMEKYYDKHLIARRGKYNEYYKERYAEMSEGEKQIAAQKATQWQKENKDKVAGYKRKYRKENIVFRLKENIRSRMYQSLMGVNKNEPTIKLLGCSIKDYKLYLESKFNENMSWDNYGTYWEIDHIKCLYKFDLTQHTQQMEAFNFTNTQPLEITENRKKR